MVLYGMLDNRSFTLLHPVGSGHIPVKRRGRKKIVTFLLSSFKKIYFNNPYHLPT